MYVLYAGIVISVGILFLELKFICIQCKYVVALARLMYCEINADRWTGCASSLYVPFICIVGVAQWLRCCATNRKVAGSIPAGVIGFFIDIKSFRSHYGPGVDSASNRNEYREYFLGAKAAGA